VATPLDPWITWRALTHDRVGDASEGVAADRDGEILVEMQEPSGSELRQLLEA